MVTTFTYTHVVNKSTSFSPIFLGPVFVHTEKNYESYFHFFSTLLKLESDIIAVETDREVAIVQALEANFHGDAVYLRCFIHMRDCIRRKLKEFSIPQQDKEQDIFGLQSGKEYLKGLVDLATPEEFDKQLAVVKIKWDTQEYSIHPQLEPCFYQ